MLKFPQYKYVNLFTHFNRITLFLNIYRLLLWEYKKNLRNKYSYFLWIDIGAS